MRWDCLKEVGMSGLSYGVLVPDQQQLETWQLYAQSGGQSPRIL
jgi:hypothetical protein